jgi:hypothetical protein
MDGIRFRAFTTRACARRKTTPSREAIGVCDLLCIESNVADDVRAIYPLSTLKISAVLAPDCSLSLVERTMVC